MRWWLEMEDGRLGLCRLCPIVPSTNNYCNNVLPSEYACVFQGRVTSLHDTRLQNIHTLIMIPLDPAKTH